MAKNGNGTAHERTVLTKDGDRTLLVKDLGRGMLVNCEERDGVPMGAVLVRNWEKGSDSEPLHQRYDAGLFSAFRGQAHHMPRSYDDESNKVRMHRGRLGWAIETSWELRRDDTEAISQFVSTLKSVGLDLAYVRNPHKVEALASVMAASRTKDKNDRFNPSSRTPIIWRAHGQLGDRLSEIPDIREHTDPRRFILASLVDQVHEVTLAVRGMLIASSKHLHKGTPSAVRQAINLAGRASHLLGKVSIAPWSVHAFRHTCKDLATVMDLAAGAGPREAQQSLQVPIRALRLVPVQLRVEELLCTVSVLKQREDAVFSFDIDAFQASLASVHRDLKSDDVDKDFKNRIAPDVRQALDEAKKAAENAETFDAKEVYDALKRAAKCF